MPQILLHIHHFCTASDTFPVVFLGASFIVSLISRRIDLHRMDFSADDDDQISDTTSMGDSNHDIESECIFCVGNFFVDLSRFHNFGKVENFDNQGWTSFDSLSQAQGTVITETMNFKSYTPETAQAFEQEKRLSSSLHVLLKFPKTQRFLVYDAVNWKLFTIQCGRIPKAAEMNQLQQAVDKCLSKEQYCKRKGECKEVNGFVLLNTMIGIRKEDPIIDDYLLRSVYDGGPHQNSSFIIELQSQILPQDSTPNLLYPALFNHSEHKLMTSVKHDSDFMNAKTTKEFVETCSGKSGHAYVCPSVVPVKTALKALNQMHDRSWKLTVPNYDASKVMLTSMSTDVDYGLFYLKAKNVSGPNRNVASIVQTAKRYLTPEFEKTSVFFVPAGKLHSIVTKDGDKPTIQPEHGVFVKLPDPEHMSEVAKAWLYFTKKLPSAFLTDVQQALCTAACEILCEHGVGTDQMALRILDLKSSQTGVHVPGGLLLVISAFLILAESYPEVNLVLETFNGKHKGIFSKVQLDLAGTPDLQCSGDELDARMVSLNSVFDFVSKFCSDSVDLIEKQSIISFGFRTIHKHTDSLSNINSTIDRTSYPKLSHVSCFPMSFFHPKQCPCLCHLLHEDVKRVQVYNESWSALKNRHVRHSRKATGQNLVNAIEGNTLNLSSLRAGLPDLVKHWDTVFQHMHDIGGSRYEVAVQPVLKCRSEGRTVFDLTAGLTLCWQHLKERFIFSEMDSLVSYGSVCSAAVMLGYRASLDALTHLDLQADEQGLIFGYMRYLNSIIHGIPTGRYVMNNPKLYLSALGFDAGRPLALTPTLPFRVHRCILKYLYQSDFGIVDPPLSLSPIVTLTSSQERIEVLKVETSLNETMVMCSCGEGFFGYNRVNELHKHLRDYPNHNDTMYKCKKITGTHWFKTFTAKKQQLEEWLCAEGTPEQQVAFENVSNGKNTLCIGKAGTGKTFLVKKLDEYLQMIFNKRKGEIVRIAPIGRVAQTFHYEARTVHASMKLHFNVDSWNDDQFVDHLNNHNVFSNMKVLIGLEMFMMTDCVLSGLLKYVKKHRPHTLVLFEGDPIQLSIFKDSQSPVLCKQEFDSMFQSVVFNTQKRISNEEQSKHLDNMRISKADADTLAYWQSKIDLHQNWDKSCLTIYALSKQADRHNEKMLQEYETSNKVTRCRIDSIDTRHGTKTSFPAFLENSCIAEHVLSLVPNAPVFINRNLTVKLHGSSKDTYVGNGTPATCLAIEKACIVLRLVSGEVVDVERISFELDDGYERKQFPLILGWASTIHKVQGMQFPKIIVDFCLDAGRSAIRDSSRPFRQGMAYMALSRSNCVAIQGTITLELLNNVNLVALEYWIHKVQYSKELTHGTKKVYRDAIHAHNNFCLQQLQIAKARPVKLAPAPSASVPASASDSFHLAPSARFESNAPAPAPAPAPANIAVSVFAPVPAPAPAIELASQHAHVSDYLQDIDYADISIDDAPVTEAEAQTNAEVAAEASANAKTESKANAETEAKSHEAAIHSATPAVRPAAAQARASVPAHVSGPAHKRPYETTGRHTRFTSKFVDVLASAPAPTQSVAHKRQAPLLNPGPRCTPSVFPATMTFSSTTKKRKTFPTMKKVGDLIEVSS